MQSLWVSNDNDEDYIANVTIEESEPSSDSHGEPDNSLKDSEQGDEFIDEISESLSQLPTAEAVASVRTTVKAVILSIGWFTMPASC